MSNLIDYVKWRGDLPFVSNSFNDIDALILCQISYLNFDGLVSSEVKKSVTLSDLWNTFKSDPDFERRSDLGMLINKDTVSLFEQAACSPRFSGIRIAGYVNKIDVKADEQFSACTYFVDKANKNPFVVFRGTDDTIVGWKEDFNMAFSDQIPAQLDSVSYAETVLKSVPGKISIAGHSKGGNLAVYSACFMNSGYKKRIERVYNFDGPGFSSKIVNTKEYKSALSRVHSWFPEHSVVGMLFEYGGKYTVVKSDKSSVWQHDPLSWNLMNSHFVTVPELNSNSIYFNRTFNNWITSLAPEKLKKVIDSLFEVIGATGASTNSELETNFFGNSKIVLKAIHNIDRSVRVEVLEMIKLFFSSVIDTGLFQE
ncbi:MAG: Mbeg1-like protein [Treponema sp.]